MDVQKIIEGLYGKEEEPAYNEEKALAVVFAHVMRSRMYRSIYVRVEDREHFKKDIAVAEGCVIRPRLSIYGRKANMHKCYAEWLKHPIRAGKPVRKEEMKEMLVCLQHLKESK